MILNSWRALSAALVTIAALACSDPEPPSSSSRRASSDACEPGETTSCPCSDGTQSTQTCTDDGQSFGACACAAGVPPATGGSPAAPGTGGTTVQTGGSGGAGATVSGSGGTNTAGSSSAATGGMGNGAGALDGGYPDAGEANDGGFDASSSTDAGGGAGGAGGAGGTSGAGGTGGAGGTTGGAGGTTGGAGGVGGSGGIGPDPTAQSASQKGPYSVQSYTSGWADSPAYATATMWYPGDGTPPYAGVAVCPGWTETQLLGWGEFLSSHGFIVLTIDTNNALTDFPAQRATALMAAVETIQAENTRAGSPLYGKVDTGRMAIMGHSMGGGGSLIAADSNSSELKAVIPLTPWSSSPTSFPGITAPTMIIAGELDTVAGVNQHAYPFYQSIPLTTEKSYVELDGADHFVANNPLLNAYVARYALSWLEVYVYEDARYAQFLVSDPAFSRYD